MRVSAQEGHHAEPAAGSGAPESIAEQMTSPRGIWDVLSLRKQTIHIWETNEPRSEETHFFVWIKSVVFVQNKSGGSGAL